jgi:hypothetical protein
MAAKVVATNPETMIRGISFDDPSSIAHDLDELPVRAKPAGHPSMGGSPRHIMRHRPIDSRIVFFV